MSGKTMKENLQSFAVKKILHYMDEDPDKSLPKLLDWADKFDKDNLFVNQRKVFHDIIENPDNNWYLLIKSLWTDIDPEVRKTFFENFIVNTSLIGSERQNKAQADHNCNIPWAVLMDPTSACNLHCTGCWAAEYGNKLNMSYEMLDDIIRQGTEIGTFMYIFSGGEPLVCKKDIIRLCEENPDCAFFAFTNGTLVDDAFVQEIKRVGNFALAFSIEGYEDATDMRRGDGTYQKVLAAMEKMKAAGLPFGYSACYHSKNVEEVCSKEYIDFLVNKGALFAWYFTYMPVGKDAVPELIANADQRKKAYELIRQARKEQPLFALDFWNDGEYVQGCIAGGRHYLHINANGDVEPCAFVHYSNVNIKDCSLIEALQSPLFMEYYKGQPWNENHLRPCPVLDNPEKIKQAVERSGAHSTEMLAPESVDDLIAKTKPFAEKWAPVADMIWNDTDTEKHNNPTVMYQAKK